MSRYIDADKLKERMRDIAYNGKLSLEVVENIISYTPAADVQEVKHGRWDDLHCTVCGKVGWSDEDDYCPNCGSRMDLDENEATTIKDRLESGGTIVVVRMDEVTE